MPDLEKSVIQPYLRFYKAISAQFIMEILRPAFLGAITEVCIVTADHQKTMDGLLRLGIGPFQVFDFTPSTLPERYFRGAAGSFELKVCFAKQGDLTFEIMQPTAGESLMAEYLDQVRTPTIDAWFRVQLTKSKGVVKEESST